MHSRTTKKGTSDNYMEARNAILSRAKTEQAHRFMWLEVSEGQSVDQQNYQIHASNERNEVPPFAIEVYEGGTLIDYEVRRATIAEYAMMPEELRLRIVQSQLAGAQLEQAMDRSAQPQPAAHQPMRLAA